MAITFVQSSGKKETGSGTSVTATITCTAGNMMAVLASNDGARTFTVSDNNSNTWSQAVHSSTGNPSKEVADIWYAANINGGSTTVTITASGTTVIVAVVLEYSGMLTASPLDKTATHINTTITTSHASGTTATTSQANELLLGLMSENTGSTSESITDPGSTTNRLLETNGSSFNGVAGVERIVAATGAYSFTWTTGDSVADASCIATFKASGSSTNTKTFTADAINKATLTKTFTLDSILRTTRTNTFTLDEIVRQTRTATVTLDAITKATKVKTATLDAIILQTRTA